MGEQIEDPKNESNMNNSEALFDNFTILKEFSNIANLVRDEDFLQTVPKAKLKRVKWVPMFNFLKQGILKEMIQEISYMWEFENMPVKLYVLEKQKEKFTELNPQEAWRPKLNDVKAQLKAIDMINLQKQKVVLDSIVQENDVRVNRLKKIVAAKRGYLKALQMDIQKYQKKNDELYSKIVDKIENNKNLVKFMIPVKTNVDDINQAVKECSEYE
ncbi:uncharacterized protein [Battus philenor]|uniref:uncharacterized protein n=1 Tax=Battus philenor TaxID=42288 RepID=UPI0035D03C59